MTKNYHACPIYVHNEIHGITRCPHEPKNFLYCSLVRFSLGLGLGRHFVMPTQGAEILIPVYLDNPHKHVSIG